MTRKDYVVLAAALSESFEEIYRTTGADAATAARTVLVKVADALAADNPKFDRARFYAAAQGRFGSRFGDCLVPSRTKPSADDADLILFCLELIFTDEPEWEWDA